MPPNIPCVWDEYAATSCEHHLSNEHLQAEKHTVVVFPQKSLSVDQLPTSKEYSRRLWKAIVQNDNDTINEEAGTNPSLFRSLSSIIVLNDKHKQRDWLDLVGGILSEISSDLLLTLRKHAPRLRDMSTVADFNDNLLYQMQQDRNLRNLPGINANHAKEIEAILKANEYLGSFLTTKSSLPQPAHVDYPWEVLEKHEEDRSLKLGFFPLTEEGMFLQIWHSGCSSNHNLESEGQIVFIPFGKILIVPASTIHGGGFRTTTNNDGPGNIDGNLRFHLYIATNDASLPAHQTNKYTERHDKTKELSRRYVDSKHMQVLLGHFFV